MTAISGIPHQPSVPMVLAEPAAMPAAHGEPPCGPGMGRTGMGGQPHGDKRRPAAGKQNSRAGNSTPAQMKEG